MAEELHAISPVAVADADAERIPRVDPGYPPSRTEREDREIGTEGDPA